MCTTEEEIKINQIRTDVKQTQAVDDTAPANGEQTTVQKVGSKKVWQTGDEDTIERNLPQMSEASKNILAGVNASMEGWEESNLWTTMGNSFMNRKVALMNSLWDGRDSDEMKAVKIALDKLSLFYQTSLSQFFSGQRLAIDETTGFINRDNLLAAKREAIAEYEKYVDEVIINSNFYINSKNPYSRSGKARLRNVKALKRQLEAEKGGFDGAFSFLVDNIAKKKFVGEEKLSLEDVTFSDVLRVVRSEKHDLSESGGGVGNTFSFKDAEQKTYFFKNNEKIIPYEELPRHFLKIIDMNKRSFTGGDAEMLENLHACTGHLVQYSETLKAKILAETGKTNLEDAITYMNRQRSAKKSLRETEAKRETYEKLGKLIKMIMRAFTYNDKVAMVTIGELKREADGFMKSGVLPRLHESIEFIVDTAVMHGNLFGEKHHSEFFSSIIANSNGIEEACTLSLRSVATSRLADEMVNLTGDQDLAGVIVKSRNAIVACGGGYKSGIVMEGAAGKEAGYVHELAEKKSKPLIFTAKAAKQYNYLMIFDFICSQNDRHDSNFLYEYEETRQGFVITGVHGIDNDFSFGRYTGRDLKDGFNRTVSMIDEDGKFAFKYIDARLKNAILSMDDTFMALIKNMFADCDISQEQLAAMKTRIDFLKESITKSTDLKTIDSDKAWKRLTFNKIRGESEVKNKKMAKKNHNMCEYIFHTFSENIGFI